MNIFLKTVLLAAYALALASLVWPLPYDAGPSVRRIVFIVLAVHGVELIAMFKHLHHYRGPLAASVLLTLLFGMLHWKPLADAKSRVALG